MRKVMVILGLMGILLLTLSMPVTAQSGFSSEEQALIDDLQMALDQFALESSYSIRGVINLVQSINIESTALSGTLDQTIDQKMSGEYVRVSEDEVLASLEIDQSISQTFPGQPMPILVEQTLEMIIDGDLFMRFSNLSADLAGMFPEDWVNLSEDPNAFPGAEVIRAEQFTALIGQAQITYPLDEMTITSIEAVSEIPEELAQDAVRGIRIEYDIQAVYEQGGLDAVLSTLSLDTITSQFGMDFESFLENYVSNADMTITYFLDEDNARIVGAETILMGQIPLDNIDLGGTSADLDIDQTQTILIQYSNFGENFDIQAPQ
ncbi:MAG: hypothetical protein J0M33_19220 [Anaerolineae bacterium]|nr:hypothetical protein [Anaerolineae bacterium]